jgi:hypothetical protein
MRNRRALAATGLVAALLVLVSAWGLPERAAAKKRARPPVCPGGRFVVLDSNTSAVPGFRCCQTCPEGFRNTDQPCLDDGSNIGSCATPPPECP